MVEQATFTVTHGKRYDYNPVAQLDKLIPGSAKFGDLLRMWGPYHRVVVLNQEKLPYGKEPGQRLPGFAYVTTMRDPQFGKSLDGILRATALLAGLAVLGAERLRAVVSRPSAA